MIWDLEQAKEDCDRAERAWRASACRLSTGSYLTQRGALIELRRTWAKVVKQRDIRDRLQVVANVAKDAARQALYEEQMAAACEKRGV